LHPGWIAVTVLGWGANLFFPLGLMFLIPFTIP
jgi:hypothetical protein